jgi:succinate dehydrogenase / fumarate reductase cytochrome b subunit
MAWFTDFYQAAVGKKAVMAVTGLILFGFILLHMVGNLHLYEGPGHLDEYGTFLRQVGAPALPPNGALWLVRLVLLTAVVLHIWAAWQVTRMSREARPSRYEHKEVRHTSYASRTMRWGGVIILLFIIYHILHFTTGTVHPTFVEGAVYRNVVTGFRVWWVSLFYIVAQVALGLHLYHGVWSLFQSLGWNHPRFNHWRDGLAHGFAWLITLGNISFPIAVLTGLVR